MGALEVFLLASQGGIDVGTQVVNSSLKICMLSSNELNAYREDGGKAMASVQSLLVNLWSSRTTFDQP